MLSSDLTSVEVLGLAISQEVMAHKRYKLFASRVKNPLVKEKFLSLAREEMAHRKMLYSLLQQYTGEAKPPLPKKAPRLDMDAEVNRPLPEILKLAIEKEREARVFYRDAANKASDPTGKRILLYLAQFEEGHERTLRIELEEIFKDPEWFELDGSDFQPSGQ